MRLPAIRAAHCADLAGILELYQHLNADDPTPEPAKVGAAWASLMRSEGITILVTEMAGVLVATATLVVIPNLMRGTRPYALIENVVSHKAHRGQGPGFTRAGKTFFEIRPS